jgi:two-component system response regulator WspF
MKIGIVNDVPLAVEAIRRILSATGRHQIIWTAPDGLEAVRQCTRQRPDLVLMDLIMPHMDGIQATRAIMQQCPCAILVVTASVDGHASRVFEALGAGAVDAVATPMLIGPSAEQRSQLLLAKIDQIGRRFEPTQSSPERFNHPALRDPADQRRPWLVAIGASAGGPPAIAHILQHFEPGCDACLVVVQHLDESFAPEFARWLANRCPLPVILAEPGGVPSPNTIHIAGKDDDLSMVLGGQFARSPRRAGSHHGPSIDVFFESAAVNWPGRVAGVILTGMGSDGARGLRHLRQAGYHTYAQDRASSAVFGMPKAAAECGAAQHILSLSALGPSLRDLIRRPPKLMGST